MDGLILYRDTYPGGPIAYFSDVSQWSFVVKNHVYTAQTLIGDGVIVSFNVVKVCHPPSALQLYRCYVVWQSKLILVLPALLWLTAGGWSITYFGVTEIIDDTSEVTGIAATHTAQHVEQSEVFGGALSRWITSFWASALATNLLTTCTWSLSMDLLQLNFYESC